MPDWMAACCLNCGCAVTSGVWLAVDADADADFAAVEAGAFLTVCFFTGVAFFFDFVTNFSFLLLKINSAFSFKLFKFSVSRSGLNRIDSQSPTRKLYLPPAAAAAAFFAAGLVVVAFFGLAYRSKKL